MYFGWRLVYIIHRVYDSLSPPIPLSFSLPRLGLNVGTYSTGPTLAGGSVAYVGGVESVRVPLPLAIAIARARYIYREREMDRVFPTINQSIEKLRNP